MANLSLVNLTKNFDEVIAVDNLSLEVHEGEFVTLLGPSGCGKTTTLRTVAGFYYPDHGEVYFGKKLMNNVPPNKRDTAMCFQSYALFPHMSVADNITFGLKMKKVSSSEQKRRLHDVMSMLDLVGLDKRKPAQLSGGQQQRVALARAIVTEPQVLLFDEPLSNLDAKLRVQVRVEIREMQKRLGITTLYVTHDQDEALAISDRIVVMDQGQIIQLGDPYTIYRRPETKFVAGFIGLANIVKGEIIKREGHLYTVKTPVGTFVIDATDQLVADDVKEIEFSWRPEDMKISQEGDPNTLDGIIHQVVFMGDVTDLFVEVKGVKVRAQTDDIRKFQEHDRISFSIPHHAFSIFRR
ncbi:MAG: ABC transporter ATP-binding protein [Sphaerochaetaceae bacterium]